MGWKSAVLAFASQRVPGLSRHVLASAGYTFDLDALQERSSFSAWNADTAARQDRAWQGILDDARRGQVREDVRALYRALAGLGIDGDSILEVGCGSGYFSELLSLQFPAVDYAGVDLSPAMIDIARRNYPARRFEVGSAYELSVDAATFDIVLDGVALIHMTDWPRAIAEYARVARRAVVLHGVTVTADSATRTFAKYAYGQPTLELAFERGALLETCRTAGLELVDVVPGLGYDLAPFLGIETTEETWVLRVSPL